MLEKLESPVMSAYSDRDPPSENSFSLPPISLKLSPSPESSYGHEGSVPSHYSSRASSFMFSRRSSRMSGSISSSPTKFPTIDRHKSNSISNLSTSRSLVNRNGVTRENLCKSPSCPQFQWDEYEEITSASTLGDENPNGDINVSVHPSTRTHYESGNEMKLPNIFSSNGNIKKAKRDSSLPRLDGGMKGSLTDRNGGKVRRESLPSELKYADLNILVTPRMDKQTPAVSGFLVPITEAEKSTSKSSHTSKNKKRNKVGPSKSQQQQDSGLSDTAVQNGGSQNGKWDIHEEDENIDTVSTGSNDGLHAIEEIARENNVITTDTKTQKKNMKGKKR